MKPDSPYVGPRTFTEKERSLFFGRDREVEDLIHLLLAERIVLLHSPSGAGKSSLLQAGLIPKLQELHFETKGPLRVNDCANFPWEENLSKDPNGEVIIFDQFEEIVTVDPLNVDAKRRFFQQLGRALHNRKRWAVFAIREDYLATLDPYLNFIPTRLSNTFRLNLLGEKAAKDAICLPAQNAGIPFTKEASDALFDDLRTIQIELPGGGKGSAKGEFVEPVQLQVVCSRIWSDLPGDVQEIGVDNIRAKKDGGNTDAADKDQSKKDQAGKTDSFSEVDRALADFYSETVKAVAEIPEAADKKITERDLRDWFEQHLITRQGIRTQVLRSEGLGQKISQGLIEGYVVRSETRSNRDFLELAHDRLIQPVLASNKEWRDANLSPFQREAEKWNENSERSPDRLLRGQALQQAEAWAKSNVPNATELAFLKASQGARRALWLGRIFTALLGILLVTAAVLAWEFQQEKKSYLNALTAGRKTAHDIVFQIDTDLSKVPKTTAIQKELLEKAIELNKTLSVKSGHTPAEGQHFDTEYEAAVTNWWGEVWEAKIALLDGNPEEAKAHFRDARKTAEKLANDYRDDPDAQHILSESDSFLGEISQNEGEHYHEIRDEEKARASWNDAIMLYRHALPSAEKLVTLDPKNRVWRFDLYFLYKGLGDTVEDESESREFYTKAVDESTKLAQEDPKDDKAQTLLWASLTNLGDLSKGQGDDYEKKHDEENAHARWKEASTLYQQALPIAQKLDQAAPNGGDAYRRRHMIWATYEALGDVEPDIHNKRSWYEKARKSANDTYQEDQQSAARKLLEERAENATESQAKKDLDQTLKALLELDRRTPK